MKKFALLALLFSITCALACGCSSKSNNHYHASAIELERNAGAAGASLDWFVLRELERATVPAVQE
jgi:hypothetical protein